MKGNVRYKTTALTKAQKQVVGLMKCGYRLFRRSSVYQNNYTVYISGSDKVTTKVSEKTLNSMVSKKIVVKGNIEKGGIGIRTVEYILPEDAPTKEVISNVNTGNMDWISIKDKLPEDGQDYPQPVTMASALMMQFAEDHANCKKTWQEPKPETEGKTELDNAKWWAENGERGLSSMTIFDTLSKHLHISKFNERPTHPCDPSDFRRCYLLIKAVPQWEDKLHLLKPLSPVWSNIVDNWAKLTEMLEEQMVTHKPNGMYEFMETLGC